MMMTKWMIMQAGVHVVRNYLFSAQNQLKVARRTSASSQSNVSEADESTQESVAGNIDVSVSNTGVIFD